MITWDFKRFLVLSGAAILLLALPTRSPAISIWVPFLPGEGGFWDDPTHWDGGSLPVANTGVAVGPVLVSPDSIVFRRFLAPNDAFLYAEIGGHLLTFDHGGGETFSVFDLRLREDLVYELDGGTIESNQIHVGQYNASGTETATLNIRSGSTILPIDSPFNENNAFRIGGNSTGVVNQYGGNVSHGSLLISTSTGLQGDDPALFDGTYNLSGGHLDVLATVLGDDSSSQIGNAARTAELNITGGSMTTLQLFLNGRSNSVVNLSGGSLTLDRPDDNATIHVGWLPQNASVPVTPNVSELNLSGTGTVISDNVKVGIDTPGLVTHRNTASLTAFLLQVGAESIGEYQLEGGQLNVDVLYVGSPHHEALGTFTQSGGVVTITDSTGSHGFLSVRGYDSDHRSHYNLNGGTLDVEHNITVRHGNLTQTAGSILAGGVTVDESTFSMDGGSLNANVFWNNSSVTLDQGTMTIADRLFNSGTFTQNGGTLINTERFESSGSYIKTGGTANLLDFEGNGAILNTDLNVTGTFIPHTFLISGANLQLNNVSTIAPGADNTVIDQVSGDVDANAFTVGLDSLFGGTSIWVLRDGTLETTSAIIGQNAKGTFRQRGGQFRATNDLDVGVRGFGGNTTEGRFELIDGSSQVSNAVIGLDSTGVLLQTGGTFQASNQVVVGSNNGETNPTDYRPGFGTLQIDAGTFTTDDLLVGDGGEGMVTVNGGNLTVDEDLQVGVSTFAPLGYGRGTFNQTGGVVNADTVSFGNGAVGIGTISGGTLNAVDTLSIGGSHSGELTLSGTGALNAQTLQVNASGTLTLNDGVTTISGGSLISGGVTLETGAIWSTGSLDLGGVPGRLTWNGGQLSITNSNLVIGSGSTWGSALSLSTNQHLTVTQDLDIVSQGEFTIGAEANVMANRIIQRNGADFTQTGGTLSATVIDLTQDSSNVTTISGGHLHSTGDFHYTGGESQIGQFQGNTDIDVDGDFHVDGFFSLLRQSGSATVDVGGNLVVGTDFSDDSTYDLRDDAHLTAHNTIVGDNGDGWIIQRHSSIHTVHGQLELGQASGTSNRYSLQGGTLQTGSTIIGAGTFSTGLFSQSGGSHEVEGDLEIGAGFHTSGRYQLYGGALEADQIKVGVNGTGEFIQTAGTTTADSRIEVAVGSRYEISGGSISAPVFDNDGTLSVDAAAETTLAARLDNSGTLELKSDLRLTEPASTHVNSGRIGLDGGTLIIDGNSQFDNLNEGEIIQNGTILVESGSLLTNSGLISPGTSPGELTIDGDFEQLADGTIYLEIEGPDPGTGYDQIHFMNGNVVLGGNLVIDFNHGYVPMEGDSFILFTGLATYNFASVQLLEAPSGFSFVTSESPGEFTLNVVPEPGTSVLVLGALAALGFLRRRRSPNSTQLNQPSGFTTG